MPDNTCTLFDIDPTRLDRRDLPLYGRLIDDFVAVDRRSSQGKWLVGAVLRFVRDEAVYKDHGCDTFAEWLRQRQGFDTDQAERYIQIADLPLELLKDVQADIHRLVAVRSKAELFWPPLLIAAGEGAPETALNRAARAGKAHLLEYGDEDAACDHVLAVARGEEVELPQKPETPAELGNRLLRAVRGKGVKGTLEALLEMKQEGRGLRGKWMDALWSELQEINQKVAALCDQDPQELAGSVQAQPPAATPAPRRPETPEIPAKKAEFPPRGNPEIQQKNEGLSSKNAPPPIPDPCPLCQGRAEQGLLRHQPGCALAPEDRRCLKCGATVNPQGELVHQPLCLFAGLHDERHEHTWRCGLDALCRFYQGSPGGKEFKLPLEPGCPTDRPWLYHALPPASAEEASPAPAPAAPAG